MRHCLLLIGSILFSVGAHAQSQDSMTKLLLNQVQFRNIGPAKTSGRVVDFAVDSENSSIYYAATAYGGVWKTVNNGTTFEPIFDRYGTQSIGCVALNPHNRHEVFVGTGENNNQRSVGYGNGLYKSSDDGKSFHLVGLKTSEHIGNLAFHPTEPLVMYAAAYGPVWSKGGERGVYKSEDGGETWNQIHQVSEYTGCNEIHVDPNNSNVLYAAYHQRMRHEYTYLGGGPESAVYRSQDGGKTWKKLSGGLPGGDLGRIALALPADHAGWVYAMVEGSSDKGGIYLSTNFGESWKKQNPYQTSGNYYQELVLDPNDGERIFILDTYLHGSDDAGKTVKQVSETYKHVDNHALWVDPRNSSHWIAGCDGGIYETFDEGAQWVFKSNLPITQFYRVSVDNSEPFYYVYGGTQDNYSLGGPSRNNSNNGIGNDEWFVTVGGDGFKSQIDPYKPNIVYAQWQYGGLIRFDRVTGEEVDIKPHVGPDEPALRWNWDAPLLISRYNPARLYFAANRVFTSPDRGNSWKAISGDLSQQIDRNKLPIMDKIWGIDAVAKNQSTSIYGNITYLWESFHDSLTLFAGTDDGVVRYTVDGGLNWVTCSQNFPGAPANTYVTAVYSSRFDAQTLYVALDNHRRGDYKPYVYKSTNMGKTWVAIVNGMPNNAPVKCFLEDYKNKDLLLVGNEFGMVISFNGGKSWNKWSGGLPPIAIKDMVFQEREDDLVVATFGRGFAVCDDFHVLRDAAGLAQGTSKTGEVFVKAGSFVYTVEQADLFGESSPLGRPGNGFVGSTRYFAPNPEFGARIYLYNADEFKSIKDRRQEREKAGSSDKMAQIYPAKDSIYAESIEAEPEYFVRIRKAESSMPVAWIPVSAGVGMKKVNWNLRYTDQSELPGSKNAKPGSGPYAEPGLYVIDLMKLDRGQWVVLASGNSFEVRELFKPSLDPALSAEERMAFVEKAKQVRMELNRMERLLKELKSSLEELSNLEYALRPEDKEQLKAVVELDQQRLAMELTVYGNRALASKEFETPEGLSERVGTVLYYATSSTHGPTLNHALSLQQAEGQMQQLSADMAACLTAYEQLIDVLRSKGYPTPVIFR